MTDQQAVGLMRIGFQLGYLSERGFPTTAQEIMDDLATVLAGGVSDHVTVLMREPSGRFKPMPGKTA